MTSGTEFSPQAPCWQLASPQALLWRSWDGELVVYNHATGDTHHLDPLGGCVLRALIDQPSGADICSLIRSVSVVFEIGSADYEVQAVQHTLDELTRLRLVQNCVR